MRCISKDGKGSATFARRVPPRGKKQFDQRVSTVSAEREHNVNKIRLAFVRTDFAPSHSVDVVARKRSCAGTIYVPLWHGYCWFLLRSLPRDAPRTAAGVLPFFVRNPVLKGQRNTPYCHGKGTACGTRARQSKHPIDDQSFQKQNRADLYTRAIKLRKKKSEGREGGGGMEGAGKPDGSCVRASRLLIHTLAW